MKEFTELQGIVGGLYARVQELDPILPEATRHAIADAIYDQYKPESMDDSIPRTIEGAVLSMADKVDSHCRHVRAGPDPERIEGSVCVATAGERHREDYRGAQVAAQPDELFERLGKSIVDRKRRRSSSRSTLRAGYRNFFRERLEFYLRDARGFAYDVVNAVLAAGADDVVDAIARAEAVAKVRPSEDFESISVAFKRIKNILRQAQKRRTVGQKVDPPALQDDAERPLAECASETPSRFGNYEVERQL